MKLTPFLIHVILMLKPLYKDYYNNESLEELLYKYNIYFSFK